MTTPPNDPTPYTKWVREGNRRKWDGLPPATRHALLALAVYADWDTGRKAHPAIATLATDMGKGATVTRSALADGCKAGWITMTEDRGKAGMSNVYALTIPPEPGEPAGEARAKPGEARRQHWADAIATVEQGKPLGVFDERFTELHDVWGEQPMPRDEAFAVVMAGAFEVACLALGVDPEQTLTPLTPSGPSATP